MEQLKQRITELADLMTEFKLAEAELEEGGLRIAFRKNSPVASTPMQFVSSAPAGDAAAEEEEVEAAPAAPAAPSGMPISSPMTGIYYTAPSPNSPAFVNEGDTVTAGQVIGLIEAMKVFNEIVAPTSGTVTRMVAENGAVVQPGEPLMYIG